MIKVIKLSKKFDQKIVLDEVSFEVRESENLVVLGPTGTGKTILLKIMIGLVSADQGEVYFENKCIQTMNDQQLFELRKKIGFVFQSMALFDSMTVFDNIGLSLQEHLDLKPKEFESRVQQIITLIKMNGSEELYPRSLSGGMKRLVSIGRALALDPQYILYDEPTTGLDPLATQHICELIGILRDKHNKSSVIVTHDLEFARKIGNSILMLRGGKISKPDRELGRLYG